MGEARARKRAHAALLARGAACIYCGEPASTVEHMPPIAIFRGRQRPNEMVFPACLACNQSTKLADQVAALMSRMFPNAVDEKDRDEVRRLMRSLGNNVPGLLQEMVIGRGGQKLARREIPNLPLNTHFLRANGPLLTKHMLVFAAKLGFALHFEHFKSPVPAQGAVQPMWFTNAQALRGEIPHELIQALPKRQTLKQGIKEVSDQFSYTSAVTEDGRHSLVFGVFRESFAVAAVTALDRAEYLSHDDPDRWPLFLPGDFRAGNEAARAV